MLTLEFLDKIISILKTNNNKLTAHEITIFFITDDYYSVFKKEFKINNYLPILIKDNYVKEAEELFEMEGFGSSNVKYYSLTAEGLSFAGYVDTNYSKLSLEQENKLLRLSQIELNRSTLSTNHQMTYLTRIIAFGTAVAAIYYLVEIVKALFFCDK